MCRVERELGVEFPEHWVIEAELQKASLEHQALDVVEDSKAWISKHKDLVANPKELRDWALTLDAREKDLLPDDRWSDELVSTRLERRALIDVFPSIELENRLGLSPDRPPPPVDATSSVAMRKPCQVERQLEERLGLSTSCRVFNGTVDAEATQDRDLERELEKRLGLSSTLEFERAAEP